MAQVAEGVAASDGPPGGGDVVVGPVTAEDWSVLKRVRLAALAESPRAFLGSLAEESLLSDQDWRDRCSGSLWILARSGGRGAGRGKVVGVANLARSDEPEGVLHIEGMWVDPSSRGRGVAERMVRFLEESASGQGEIVLGLWVFDGNPSARACYERLGFEPLSPEPRRQRLDDFAAHRGDDRVEEELRKQLR